MYAFNASFLPSSCWSWKFHGNKFMHTLDFIRICSLLCVLVCVCECGASYVVRSIWAIDLMSASNNILVLFYAFVQHFKSI